MSKVAMRTELVPTTESNYMENYKPFISEGVV